MFKFLLIFFIDIINPLIHLLRLHVTGCMYDMKFINSYIVYRNNTIFFYKNFFCRPWLLRRLFKIFKGRKSEAAMVNKYKT